MANQISTNRKVGKNRDKARIWMEGTPLVNSGWMHGDRYNVQNQESGVLVLVKSADGKRKVSGKAERPVIDISSADRYGFSVGDSVSITYNGALITIARA